ncbi:MAG: hypothetical protein FD171_1085 [Actinobacteria bacterium]|nr:MAG: hypothetical protein FD171_1085 [Actinomycetota bacterium]
MTTSELYEHLLGATLDLAWRQWSAIGVAGIRASEHMIVDPEALLLATLEVARSDARLFDEALDWVVQNSELLDVSRLRRLGRTASGDQRRLLGVAVGLTASRSAGSSLARLPAEDFIAREATAGYDSQALFRGARRDAGQWAGTDEVFARAGFTRPPLNLRAMSQRPDASRSACARFRARALVGPGPKAEVLTYLWTHEWAHGRLIADRSAYGQAPVAEYLSTLSEGGLVDTRIDGRRTLYRATASLKAAGTPTPAYVDWVRVWPALVALLDALRPSGFSEEAVWVRLAGALAAQMNALEAEGFGVEVGDVEGWPRHGTQLLENAVGIVTGRVEQIMG